MIPVLFIALALGGLAAYELSAGTHKFVDDHVKAISDALAAHREADAHLDQVHAAQDVHAATQVQAASGAPAPAPGAFNPAALVAHAWESITGAMQANAVAAVNTITALKTAKTDQQMATATQSAVAVDARQKQIAAAQARQKQIMGAMAQLGAGKCGARTYHVTPQIKDALLAKLHAAGMTVTGDNPWDVDTQQYGVTLRAVWDPQALVLKLIVSDWGFAAGLAGCDTVWAKIDPVLKEVLGA